jgi:hypothetical protein
MYSYVYNKSQGILLNLNAQPKNKGHINQAIYVQWSYLQKHGTFAYTADVADRRKAY